MINTSFKKYIFLGVIFFFSAGVVSAAKVTIDAPYQALANRQPIVVQVYLDTESETVSGISGNFSFPSDLFTLESISTERSVLPLWLNQPAVTEEKYFDYRTHITFEGIFPGGYSGVRSPYYQGERRGILFSVTLVPKNQGTATLLLDDIMLHAFTSTAERIPVESAISTIRIPKLLQASTTSEQALTRVRSTTLSALVTRDELVNHNAWYVLINEANKKSSIEKILIAETDDHNGELVSENTWRVARSPYILFYQDRTKFINIKVIYTNNTYTTLTLPPVENSQSISYISRILVSVIILLLVLYFYGNQSIDIFSKKKNE